jgi:diaminopimelate epimerase
MEIPFTKMEGVGNDYVYVDAIRCSFPLERGPELARAWSDRHFGIGADGLIALVRGESAPVRMVMWNADGSRGAMCGNGLRCLARLAAAHGHVAGTRFDVETDSGPRAVELLSDGTGVIASMGEVSCGEPLRVEVLGDTVELVPGDAGNPHAVVFVDDVERAEVHRLGEALQRHPRFPDGVNVEFVQVLRDGELVQRTYERGSGETLACGTGAAVAAAAAMQTGRCAGNEVAIRLRGGELRAVRRGRTLAIEGPANTVFEGEIEVPDRSGR